MEHERVVVGMSGGVDSSTAAWILREAGYSVTGVTLRFYCYARGRGGRRPCCGDAALRRARRVAAALGIDHHVIDVEGAFRETVVADFVGEYRRGRTPNPCIVCNEKVKFPGLLRAADMLECARIATGHYARLVPRRGGAPLLAAARDARKDQSYFLYRVPPRILARALFPLGGMLKESVKRLAPRFESGAGACRESQDICFIPDGDLAAFLRERIGAAPGDAVDAEGRVLGRHEGVHLYTVGQRKGLGIAGGARLYVSALDSARRRIVLSPREALFHRGAVCGGLRLRTRDLSGAVSAKVRYARPAAPAARVEAGDGRLTVIFREPQWAVTPGQSLVLYRGDAVIGGGIVEREIV